MTNFSEYLRSKRAERGLSRKEIADYVGVSTEAVRQWEQDITSPSEENVRKLARALGVHLKEIVYENNGKLSYTFSEEEVDPEVSKLNINVKNIRSSLKLTQEDLADILGVTRQTIANYENGTSIPAFRKRVLMKMQERIESKPKSYWGGKLGERIRNVSENIKLLRKNTLLTDFSQKVSIPVNRLIDLELGSDLISIYEALRICDTFKVSLDWLIDKIDVGSLNTNLLQEEGTNSIDSRLALEKDGRIKVLEKLVEQQQDIIDLYKKLSNSDKS